MPSVSAYAVLPYAVCRNAGSNQEQHDDRASPNRQDRGESSPSPVCPARLGAPAARYACTYLRDLGWLSSCRHFSTPADGMHPRTGRQGKGRKARQGRRETTPTPSPHHPITIFASWPFSAARSHLPLCPICFESSIRRCFWHHKHYSAPLFLHSGHMPPGSGDKIYPSIVDVNPHHYP